MNEITLIHESLQQARRDLGLEEDLKLQAVENPYERLLDFLEQQIRHMLDQDFAGLITAMYRVDIHEQVVAEIIEKSPPNQMARELAQVVIAREKQKVVSRQQHFRP